MKIKCKCGEIVAEGEIGKSRRGKKILNMDEKPKGTIKKNKSNNPDNWTAICSKCQSAHNE